MSGILTSNLFGPINRDYCMYFYVLSALGLFFFAVAITGSMYVGFTKGKGFDFYLLAIQSSLIYFVIYLQNRLLFNMCSKSL